MRDMDWHLALVEYAYPSLRLKLPQDYPDPHHGSMGLLSTPYFQKVLAARSSDKMRPEPKKSPSEHLELLGRGLHTTFHDPLLSVGLNHLT